MQGLRFNSQIRNKKNTETLKHSSGKCGSLWFTLLISKPGDRRRRAAMSGSQPVLLSESRRLGYRLSQKAVLP